MAEYESVGAVVEAAGIGVVGTAGAVAALALADDGVILKLFAATFVGSLGCLAEVCSVG